MIGVGWRGAALGWATPFAVSTGDRTSWTYDLTGQLTGEFRTGTLNTATTFTYDPAGNRATKSVDGETTLHAYDAANRLLVAWNPSERTTYSYDAVGNQTRVDLAGAVTTTIWNAENQAVAVLLPDESVVTYTYNIDKKRISKTDDLETVNYIWDKHNLAFEEDEFGTALVEYTFQPQEYGDLLSQHRDGGSLFHHFDVVGSTAALTDSSAVVEDTYRFTAWGEEATSSGTTLQPYLWNAKEGYYRDEETGWYNLRRRDYDTRTGRFRSEDPIRFESSDENFYRYTANNPINNSDPSGLDSLVEAFRNDKTTGALVTNTYWKTAATKCGAPQVYVGRPNDEKYPSIGRVLEITSIERDSNVTDSGMCIPYKVAKAIAAKTNLEPNGDIQSRAIKALLAGARNCGDYKGLIKCKMPPAAIAPNLAPSTPETPPPAQNEPEGWGCWLADKLLDDFCGTIGQLVDCLRKAGGAAGELAEVMAVFTDVDRARQVLDCLAKGMFRGMTMAINYLRSNSMQVVRQILKEVLGADIDLDALLSGDPTRILGALATALDLSVSGIEGIAYEAARELKIADTQVRSLVSTATQMAMDWMSGKPIEGLTLPTFDELKQMIVSTVSSELPGILADVIGEAAKKLTPGVGALSSLYGSLKAFLTMCDQLVKMMQFLIQSICSASNCNEAIVQKIATGFSTLIVGMIAPFLKAVMTALVPGLIKKLQELVCKIKAKIREFMKKVLSAILQWLLKGKRPGGKPGATPAGPACGLPGTGSNTAPAAPPKGGAPKPCGNCFVAGTLVKTNADRMLIERILVNERINPALPDGWEVAAAPIEGRYVDWRQVELVLLADNARCGTATLLRPAAWVEDEGAVIGERIYLDLKEIGIEGPAQVVSIEETIVVPGPGRLVTGVFRHTTGEILELKIEGENQPIGTTKSHPFWSVDQEDWISAQDLQPGELLLNDRNQAVRLESITEHDEPQEVYNLEIDGDHCYRVGEQGLLVHNVSSGCVNNRKGFIEYQEEDTWGVTKKTSDHYSGRPRGARALISPSMLGTGSDASSYLLPPGWDELPAINRGRAHLVAKQLGGSGKDARNIVAMFQYTANSPAMSSCEGKIAAAVRNGECVEMKVIANYNRDDPKPVSITIEANGDRGCFSLTVTIPNSKSAVTPSQCR